MNFNIKMKENNVDSKENKMKSTPIAMVAPELKQNLDKDSEICKTCAVLGCEEYKNLGPESFFRFPEEPKLRELWTDLTGRSNWTPNDYSYVCIRHFPVDCFHNNEQNIMVLSDKAVPAMMLPRHVLEVEYIDEDTLEYNEEHLESDEEFYDFLETEEYGDDPAENPPQPELPQSDSPQPEPTSLDSPEPELPQPDSPQPDPPEPDQPSPYPIRHGLQTDRPSEYPKRHGLQPDNPSLGPKRHSLQPDRPSPYPKQHGLQAHHSSPDPKRHGLQPDRPEPLALQSDPAQSDTEQKDPPKPENYLEALKLFSEVQKMQRLAVTLKDKLKFNIKRHNKQIQKLKKLKERIAIKREILESKKKNPLQLIQDKLKQDSNELLLAMPLRPTDDLKQFALNIYNYSPESYIYVRNSLRTLLPSIDVLKHWLDEGFEPQDVLSNVSTVKVITEHTDKELTCKISIS